jgi:magnesium Mg(2+) and cobalt Co(2+) transport protein (corA)
MSKSNKNISKKAGLPPGSLIHIGNKKTEQVKITIIDYDKTCYNESFPNNIEECFTFKETESVSWINIDGLHDTKIIKAIGDHFDLHHLVQEDILNTSHRPKIEEFDDFIFLTLKMHGIGKDKKSIITEQVSFVLGKNWVISFQEKQGDIFDNLRIRLRDNVGTIRKHEADYLLYRLIDTIVDNYFFVTENLSEQIEVLEEKVLKVPDQQSLHDIQTLKKLLIKYRKSTIPLREAILILQKGDMSLIKNETSRYFRDVYEHIIHVNDSIDTQRDMLVNIMDLYHSGISNNMNQVMKVLTIIATIFIPLTFIAGIYGMNFDYMPELHWKYGYFGVWGLMIIVFILMVFYFRKKKWL